MKRLLFSLLIVTFGYFSASAQGNFCYQATGVLTGYLNTYPAGVNSGTAEVGADYGCLGSQPNPVWYYLHIGNSGPVDIEMHSSPQHDIDFVCWGPFPDPVTPCVAQLTASTIVDCSYSASWQEYCILPNPISGQFYILMITNFSNMSCDITFSQTGGTGSLIYSSFISGSVYNDVNGNGVKDTTEVALVGKKVKLIDKNLINFTQSDGNYYFACDSGTYQVKCLPSTYWNITSDSILSVYVQDSITAANGNNFCMKIQESSSDVSIDITGNPAVADNNVNYWLTYKNEAAMPKTGTVVLTIDPLTTFVSSVPPPDAQSGNIITWNYANLLSLETRQIDLMLHMPGVINLGDTITTTAIINPIPGDMFPPNNYDTIHQVIIGSFDPNDKIVDKGVGPQGYTLLGEPLEYTIRFQNTGTAAANTVRIHDKINSNMDMESFCLIASSHDVSVEMADSNRLIFLFENIMLPDSGSNQAGSCGFVKFVIKPNDSLPENTVVTNQAKIYFDFNPAILTNQTLNTYINEPLLTDLDVNLKDNAIVIFPNPTKGLINITFTETDKDARVDVMNSCGQMIISKAINNQNQTTLDLSGLVKGMYFIKVQTENKVMVKKIVIE